MLTQKRIYAVLSILVLASMVLAACATPTAQVIEKTVEVVTTKEVPVVQTQVVTQEVMVTQAPVKAFTTPDPILSDIKVRQALAYCTNKLDLIKSVYPLLTEDEQKALVMDTFIPKSHWAYAGDSNITIYPFDVEKGKALLDEAGWKLAEGADYRTNANGDELLLKFTTTNATFRQTWAAVWEAQMKDCGVLIVRQHVPASWWFGDTTGVAHRDFQLGAFAWVGQADPGGQTLYSCDQIPTPDNGWQGQNDMGWCNQKASDAIKKANNTLIKQERIDAYKIVQQEFANDMVSLPLFNRTEVFATAPDLKGFESYPGDQGYYVWNLQDWEMPGKDTIVLGFTQEPGSLYWNGIAEQAARQAYYIISGLTYTSQNYDFQPREQKELSTLESGLATMADVDVKEGDPILDANGNIITLTVGTKIVDNTGATVEFKGDTVKMKQMTVKYQFVDGLTFSDGKPLTQADLELGYKVNCDKTSNGVTYTLCDSLTDIKFDGLSETVTWKPGFAYPLYFLEPAFGWYPAHRVIESEGPYKGKTLADVAPKDYSTLPEIATNPIDVGPYVLTEWTKGEKMVFEANPYWYLGKPKTAKIIISMVTPENAEAQLLGGQVDVLDSTTLTAVSQTLKDAADQNKAKVLVVAGATWEHIDMNLFLK